MTQVYRITRDSKLVRDLKSLYDFACQVCGLHIQTLQGSPYIEVHHVQALGGDHAGLDIQANMLVLCPNHHAMFDLGIPRFLSPKRIEIEGVAHNLITKHELLPQFIEYHNSHWQTLNL